MKQIRSVAYIIYSYWNFQIIYVRCCIISDNCCCIIIQRISKQNLNHGGNCLYLKSLMYFIVIVHKKTHVLGLHV